jgi:hypothetical protein
MRIAFAQGMDAIGARGKFLREFVGGGWTWIASCKVMGVFGMAAGAAAPQVGLMKSGGSEGDPGRI